MPKKRSQNLKQYQSSSGSNQAGSSSHGAGSESTASVNERLSALRQVETAETLQKKRDLAALVSQARTVPPELRRILGVPESAPPKPKIGVRLREMRRTPGPAPPKSWLGFRPIWEPSLVVRGARGKRKVGGVREAERNRPNNLQGFALQTSEDESDRSKGLVHLALKRLAEQWDLFDEDDYPALAEIPLRLRLRLLSYLGFYGPSIDAAAFRALTAGSEPITYLDLAGLAGYEPLSIKKLAKALEPNKEALDPHGQDQVADSWDAEDSLESLLPPGPTISRFAGLTHLCLSNPPFTASWRDLLSLSKHLPQLTHLSLAYWPRPTLTPNLTAARVSSKYSPDVYAGGSNYYSGMDQEFREPASILRQLSGNLLRLQWLDIEGCAAWMPALAMLSTDQPHRASIEGWADAKPVMTIIFTETWQNLTYIKCAQSWLPTDAGVERAVNVETYAGLIELEHQNWLKHRDHFPTSHLPLDDTPLELIRQETQRAQLWLETEQRLFSAARRINTLRRGRGAKPVVFDFGWIKKAV